MRHGPTLAFSFGLLLWATLAPAAPLAALPAYPEGSYALEKAALTISFNPLHRQADWVFYDLGPGHLQNCVQRADSFRADPSLPAGVSPTLNDYRGSGYDRGHLSPAGDNKWSHEAMHESFLLSNISPQPSAFNRGIWAKLEGLVRAWANEGGGLWVATGPVLKRGLATIGEGRISVPEAFYKILITKDERRAIALELPTDARGDLKQYALPIRSVEEATNLNFLAGLSDDALENDLDLHPWDFSARFRYEECRTPEEEYAPAQPDALTWFRYER
jgi:endonuclease G